MIGIINLAIGAGSAFIGFAGSIHPLRLNQRPLEAVPPAFMCATLLESLCAGLSQTPHPVSHVVGAAIGVSTAAALGVGAYNHAGPPRSSVDFFDPEMAGGAVALFLGGLLGYLNPIALLARCLT